MIEPEIAFTDIVGDMDCAEGFLRFCFKHVLEVRALVMSTAAFP